MFRKLFLTCLLPLLLLCSLCTAACPLTQTSLTKMFWEHFPKKYSNAQKKEFLLGTFFPDVYYLAECSKDITYVENATLQNVLEAATPFQAGLLFRSFVEQERESFVASEGLYEYVASFNSPRPSTQLKIAEDEQLYSFSNWKICISTLGTVAEEEKTFGIKEDIIKQWHMALSYYFSYAPSTVIWYLSYKEIAAFDVAPEEMTAVYEIHKSLSNDPVIKKHTDALMAHFKNLFEDAKE